MDGTCEQCGTMYQRPPSTIGRFCSAACKRQAQRKSKTTVRRMRYAPKHPLAPPSGYVSGARCILYDRIGPGVHPCHWCGTPVEWAVGVRGNHGLVADHADNDPLNDQPGNIVPACGRCNVSRGRMVKDSETFITREKGTRLRVSKQTCRTCGKPFMQTVSLRHYCSRTCCRKKS